MENLENLEKAPDEEIADEKLKKFQEMVADLKEQEDQSNAHFRGDFQASELTAEDLALWEEFKKVEKGELSLDNFNELMRKHLLQLAEQGIKTDASTRGMLASYMANTVYRFIKKQPPILGQN